MNVANEELMRTASEEMKEFKLEIAELLQEVKNMQSELQILKNERTEYGSQGRQGKASPRRKFRRNRAYKKNGTLKCCKCRKPGHMKRDCPDRGGAAEKQGEQSSENDQLSGMGVARRQ